MRASVLAPLAVAALLLSASPAVAASPTPIEALGPDLERAFTGTNLLFYGAAFSETAVLSFGGGDQSVRVFVRTHFAAPAWGDTSNVVGYALPAIVAPGLWALGLVTRDRGALGAGSAAVQALATTLVTTALLKWTTGRPYPLDGGDPNAPDVLDHPSNARSYRPFRLDGEWAWPSGHTAATTSVVAALAAYDPDDIAIPLVGYPIAAAIGLGMVDGDRHWTSDVLAGALFGYAIGTSVGGSFRARATGEVPATRASIRFVPMSHCTLGGSLVGTW